MDKAGIEKCTQQLGSRIPIFGASIRCGAAKRFADDSSAAVIPHLIAASRHTDTQVSAIANNALCGLSDQPAIDALCDIWANSRDASIGDIIREKRYAASAKNANRLLIDCWLGRACGGTAQDVSKLVSYLADKQHEVRLGAASVLRALEAQPVIDALCDIWAKDRDETLGEIIREKRYAPAETNINRLLIACLHGSAMAATERDVKTLAALLDDKQAQVRAGAEAALRSLASPARQSDLCEVVIGTPGGTAARLSVERRFLPAEPHRLCIYLFLTRQLDRYFELDPDFTQLRLEYEQADAGVKANVMEVVRDHPDARLAGFQPARSAAATEDEIRVALESARRHKNWRMLWERYREYPLRYTQDIPAALRDAAWRPEGDGEAALFTRIQDILAGSPAAQPAGTPCVFDKWLEEGRSAATVSRSTAELLALMGKAAPPQAVAAVGALAGRVAPNGHEARSVMQSPHWLIRLAGAAAGFKAAGGAEPNYWVTELSAFGGVMDAWPSRPTPGALRDLESAPAEAFSGALGAQRRVLAELMTFALDRPQFERERKTGVGFERDLDEGESIA